MRQWEVGFDYGSGCTLCYQVSADNRSMAIAAARGAVQHTRPWMANQAVMFCREILPTGTLQAVSA